MKISYEGLSAEVDLEPVLFRASDWFRSRLAREPLARLREPIALVSSRLLAIEQGTEFSDETGNWKAAPLLKPLADGTARPIRSGFLVTGLYDALGQLAVAHSLGRMGRAFTLIEDQYPPELRGLSLFCFGSPSSNGVSAEIFDRLSSVLSPEFAWTDGFGSFTLKDSRFRSGADGVVLAYDSPWGASSSVLVSAGVGPAGTRAGAQMLTNWASAVPGRAQRRAKRFVAAVTYRGSDETPRLRHFLELR